MTFIGPFKTVCSFSFYFCFTYWQWHPAVSIVSIRYLQCCGYPGSDFSHPGIRVKKIPDLGFRVRKIPDLGTGSTSKKVFLTLKTASKLSKKLSGMFIPDPGPGSGFFFPSRIQRKKAPDLGLGSAMLQGTGTYHTYLFQVAPVMLGAILALAQEMAWILPASVGTDSRRGSDGATPQTTATAADNNKRSGTGDFLSKAAGKLFSRQLRRFPG
jgi:hypothetical protein